MAMDYRTLGRTGCQVASLGLGTEYLIHKPQDVVNAVVHTAVEAGVNFIDLLYGVDDYLDQFGIAFSGIRDRVLLAAHCGSGEQDGQVAYLHGCDDCDRLFENTLTRLGTEYIDALFVHMVDSDVEYDTWGADLLNLTRRYREQGKVRWIGLSSHTVGVARRGVASGDFDLLMFPLSAANDTLCDRQALLADCVKHDVGLVAMKPFAGGRLFQRGQLATLSKYQAGTSGDAADRQMTVPPVTAVRCLSYALAQLGVSTVIPGVANLDELNDALGLLDATADQRDYGPMLASIDQHRQGECVYCNHCLPCPSHIDIGHTFRLFDLARLDGTENRRVEYDALPAKASECIECGDCMERCPFGVNVIAGMQDVVAAFE